MRNLLFSLTLLLSSAAERCPEQHYAVTDDGSTLFSSCGKNILRWNFDGEQTKLEAQHQSISPSCSDEWIAKSTCLDSADPLRSFYDNNCPSSSIVKSLQIYDYPKSSSLIVCDDFFGGTFHMFKLNNFPDQRGRPCKDGARSFFLAKDQRLMEREADDPLVEIGEVFSKIVSDDDGRALLVVAFNVKDDIKRKYAPLSIRRFSEGDNKFQRADEIFSSTETTAFATIDNKIDFNIGVDWDKRPQFHSIIHFPKQKRVIVGYNTYESTSKSRFAHICLLDDENRNLNKKFLEFAVNCGGKTKVTDVLSFEYSWGNNRRSPEKSILFRMSDGSICFQKQSVLENQIQNRLQDRFQNCDKSQWRNVKYSDWIKNNPEDCHPRFKNIKQICDDDFKYTLESMGITAIDSISLVPVQSYSNEGNNHLRIENSFQSWSFSSVKSNEKAYNFIEVIEGENVRRFVASLSPSNSNLYLAEIDSFAEKTIKNSITKNATKWTFDGETVRAEKVNSCDRYSSCESCLAEKSDPTCGWCITTGKCSDFSTCEQNDPAYQSFPRRVKEPRFLSKEAEDYFRQPWSHKCPSLSVREETISYQNLCDKGKSCKGKSFSSIHATVDGLPERRSLLMKELQCRFTKSNSPPVSVPLKNEPIETYSQVGVYEVDCEKPPSDFIASMENSPSSSVKLSLGFAPVQGRDFVSIATADIEVFNCNKLKSCNTCLNPKYNGFCLWCYTDNHCANTKEECPHIKNILKSKSSCPNVQFLDEYVYKRPGMQTISLAASNFRINDDFDLAEADDILVELEYLDVNKNVSGKYAHPGELSFQNQFDDIPASADLEYPVNITIRVNMNGNEVIVDRSAGDNVQVQFDMFECPRIKHSCFGCLNAKPEYGCAYSIKDEKCEISKNGLLSENQVLPLQTCPNPDISKVTPNHLPLNSGPIIVEIEGRNFNPSPVGNSEVFIGNYPCRVVSCTKYGFENPERRNKTCCEFHSKSNIRADGKTNDEVTLSTSADYQVSAKFSSLGVKLGNPKALSYPEFVYSGGFQEFTIRGDFLDAGRHAEIQILGSPCTIIEPRLENEIKCITASYQSIREDSSYLQISSSSPISLSVKQIRDPRLEKFVPDKCIKNEKGSSEVEVQFFEDGHAKAFTFALLKSQDGSEGECRNSDGKLYCRCPYSSGALMGEELNLVITKESKEELKTLKAPESLQTAAEVNVINKEPIIKVTRESNETVSSGSYMIKGGPFCLGWERECEDIPWRLIFRSKENELELNRSSIIVIRNEVISWTPPSFAAYQAVFGSDQDAPSLILKNGGFEIEAVEKIEYESSNMIIIAGGGLGVALVLAIVVFAARKSRRRKERKTAQEKDRLLKGVDRTQKDEAEKYKQHLLGGIQENRPESRMPPTMPFREYRSFILHFMFPPEDEENRLYHRELCPFGTQNSRAGTIDRSMGLQEFKKLLGQREFLLVFIKTLESNSRFTSRDRSKFAAFLMISLQGKLEYATLILQYLIIDMIEKMQPNNLGTLFRHSNTIGEKMLSYWFAMLMYRTVYRRTGEHIFNLFKKLKDLVHSEPVDQITGHSRMTLSEQYLLRVININTNQLSITVLHHEGGEPQFIQISGLYCDTVDQIKERILDTIFWDMEYSKRDSVADYDLEYVDNSLKNPVRRLMKNIDSTSETKDGLRKLNTIDHYHKLFLPNTKKLDFTDKRYLELKPSTSTTMLGQSHQSGSSLSRSRINISDHPSSSNMTGTMGRSGTPLHGETVRDGRQIIDYHHVYDGMSTRKLAAPDHFTLTMIRAKESLETPIQVLIESIVSVVDRQYQMPMCIKYMFDFLDDEFQKVPQRHPDTIHKWKTNSLFLRYWVNLIKNPEFLFDINKSVAVSNSLTVVAQTLIDGCSTTESDPLLAQAQSTSKVLFSKNVHNNFREWVQSYFQEVEMRPEIPRDDFIHFLREENELHIQDFNKNFAIRELFNYAKEYYNDLLTGLNNDRECHQRKFGATLSRCISMSASAPVFAYANNHPVPAPRRVFPK
ncbi:Oidioi.mRNA.OKI2018_I69.PAR.g11444.t1.cds [Oikopleura dioica]|uniref:Oidioi.mRNA.OKI2018_I69.PAR.g11444.t1.cds n=1 Tax=Oikopleura dioica TaxID=34765 RepID=A0ABN7RWC4_OIKDI|nr:Oidioi.mRNA.OKI2018_I69.PAR.g11444.t1.cds [Oikopleura dioica]